MCSACCRLWSLRKLTWLTATLTSVQTLGAHMLLHMAL
jgi:hypothetical protein